MIELFGWGLTILSLVGKVYVIDKHIAGMWMWAASNVGWIGYHLVHDSYPAAALFGCYLVMCVWGIIKWT